MSCHRITKTIKVHGRKHRVKRRKCRTRVISGTATFTTAPAQAILTRGHLIYATGTARLNRLMLKARRPVRAGRYTLILRHRDGRRWILTRTHITIA